MNILQPSRSTTLSFSHLDYFQALEAGDERALQEQGRSGDEQPDKR